MKLILASSSPRRSTLLTEADIHFDIVIPDVDEETNPALSPKENAESIALRKAEAVAAKHPERPVLAADTMVVLDDRIIGKPVDVEDAKNMLRALSGRTHSVLTGIAVAHDTRGLKWTHVEETRVTFHHVDSSAIEKYVAGGEPMDKAGGYAIQGGAKGWIAGFYGSYTNIIGLPMEPLLDAFKRFGYNFATNKGE